MRLKIQEREVVKILEMSEKFALRTKIIFDRNAAELIS
jgi:hypothetical protein